MRRIIAAGLSALALCGLIGTTSGTANAVTDACGPPAPPDPLAPPGPAPVGKKHFFHCWIPGTDVTGVWYRTTYNRIWLETYVWHGPQDGKRGAFCYKIRGVPVPPKGGVYCVFTHRTILGQKNAFRDFVDPKAHFSFKVALGRLDPKSNTLVVTKSGRWHKLF